MADTVTKPLPSISEYNRPFWDYARQHELRLQRCLDCARPWAPVGPVCPHCFSARFEWARMSGRGTVASWVVFHKLYHPGFAEDIPYNVAFIELAEGPRLISNVVGVPNERLHIGMPVEVVFDDVGPNTSLPKFRPVKA
jgi:uncharacterized OB-fold protein